MQSRLSPRAFAVVTTWTRAELILGGALRTRGNFPAETLRSTRHDTKTALCGLWGKGGLRLAKCHHIWHPIRRGVAATLFTTRPHLHCSPCYRKENALGALAQPLSETAISSLLGQSRLSQTEFVKHLTARQKIIYIMVKSILTL